MSKLFAAIFDYLNDCEILQLDAVVVALFCLVCGCGLLISIFVAAIFQPPLSAVKPRLVVRQFASGQTQIVSSTDDSRQMPVYSGSSTGYLVPTPNIMPTRNIVPSQANFLCPATKSHTSREFPCAAFSYLYGQPRLNGVDSPWYRFGQAAAAEQR